MTQRLSQLVLKGLTLVGVSITSAQADIIATALIGIAGVVADLWIHRKRHGGVMR